MCKENVSKRPDLYDLLYSNYDEDISMYASLAEGHSEILECGIGTGRIAIPLAERGKFVHGIDISLEMLQALRNKINKIPKEVRSRISFSYTDMKNFNLERKFSFILVPFGTFNYLLTIEEQKACLLSIRNHLLEEGYLILELLSFSLFPNWLANNNSLQKFFTKIDNKTGKYTEMWGTFRFNASTQIVEQDRHFRFYDANGFLEEEVKILWKNRFFLAGEIFLLLELCGFEVENTYGDCNLGIYDHASEFILVKAKIKSGRYPI